MTDCIHLQGIRGYGYTGVLPAEQTLGQWFEVDLSLWMNLTRAGKSDRIADTLDYRLVITQVQQIIRTSQFELLERLAAELIDQVMGYPQLQKVRLRLTKMAAPIPDFTGQITIELVRSRPPTNPVEPQ
ncbi:MAG: dihydroneopterin aldolase [Acaryochloridaceae cyanobacterium SU_2_1]|nr:dihydroneopterin aldolase [Acaryochloridaceae cyanobacterium SU_2_1]NJM94969.1 dihydroneopterin aldolase [Acaryochloridaceae cyanobacterium CSU_5_19]